MSKPATVERLSATKRLRIYATSVEHHYGLPRHAANMLRKIADELEAENESLRAALEDFIQDYAAIAPRRNPEARPEVEWDGY